MVASSAQIEFEIFDIPKHYDEHKSSDYFLENKIENRYLNYFNPVVYSDESFQVGDLMAGYEGFDKKGNKLAQKV